MLVRASTFITGALAVRGGGAESRWQMGSQTIQFYAPGGVWWSKKPVITRNAPYTINNPHPGQMEARINFGSVASKHRGEKGFKDGLPIIAWHVKNEVKGYSAPDRMSPADYPSKTRHTVHTLDQLKEMLRAKAKAAAPPTI